MAKEPESYAVHGTVTGKEGRPVPHAHVFVWRKLIRDRVELAAGDTNEHGEYRLRYRPEDHCERLLVEVEARSEEFDEPLRSNVVPAQAELQIDLRLETPDTSEWATLTAAMRPALEGLKLSSLVENDDHQDVSFLALELGKSVETVMNVLVSARLEAAFGVAAPAFYAFVRQRVPSAIPTPLLEASANFTLIDALVHRIGSLVLALAPQVQTQAIIRAIALDLIGPQYTPQIPELVAALQSQRSTDLLNQPYLVGKATLAQLLSVAQIPAANQQTFAQALSSNTQSMRNFWRTLGDGNHGFSAAEASAIERTLSLGAFVKNDIALVQSLMQGFSSGTYSDNADLAKLSASDWVTLIESTGGAPAGINGAGNATPAEVFAAVVYTRVTRAYPTAALAARVATGAFVPEAQRAPLVQFFENNPSLELIKDTLSTYLATAGEKAFAGVSQDDRAAVIANLRSFQRVLRIAPNVDAAQTLLVKNIGSSTQIAAMGQQQFFVLATGAGITKTDANLIFNAAAQRYAGVVSLYTQFNLDAVGVWPASIGDTASLAQLTQQAIQRDDSLATLFGSQDYCATDDCTSILSPAAYLCDLLLWLRKHPQGGATALDVLDARRPDIRNLLLNCPNSDTELPYIDLVIELLADAIAPPADPNSTINPPWKQTTYDATPQSLLAAPQYFNQTAFVSLFGASYPQALPYSAGLDELRTYAQQLGVPLWQIRQALVPLHAPPLAVQSAVAAEYFGMPPHQVDLLTTPNLVAANIVWNTAAPATDLAAVPAFLQGASCTYESLLELLQVDWVQGGLGVAIGGLNDLCDTSTQTLTPNPLDAGFLDRAHRFLVLWTASGYKMWELDLLLGAATVANGTLDQNALVAFLAFAELQDATGLPVDAQLAFFEDIDTASHRDPDGTPTTSLYARLFLNPAVTAIAPDADLAALASGGAIADPVLLDHLPAIQAALGVTATDAATLAGLTNNELTLSNLSELYRVSALATAAKLSISDLIAVAQLLSPTSANAAAALAPILSTPAACLAFLAQAQLVLQPGFTIDALTYVLSPPPWSTTTQMTQAQLTSALQTVQQAVVTAAGVNVDGSVIAAVAANAHPPAAAPLANDVTALILGTLEVPGTGTTLLAILEDPTFAPQANPPVVTQAAFPNQFLALQLFDKCAVIVRTLRLVASELSWLLANAVIYDGLDLTQLPVTGAQPAIPLGPMQTTLLLIKLERLLTAAPPASNIQTLFDVIGGVNGGTLANAAQAQAALATISGWPLADIVAFSVALGVMYPADYLVPAVYDALRNLEAMATASTASGQQLVAWAATPVDEPSAETMAASALAVVKAQYPNNDNWLAFAPTLMDPIRERRAAALSAYLIGQRDGGGNLIYGDTNGLFDYFLIDTQMTSCEATSRIVQAYIAVQIFVERCLMNLEAPKVVVDLTVDDTWSQWDWMKRYRIWEANREVFLYPENWLIESQRPNRTEIYQQFEQTVRQGQSTTDYLETTVLSYIDGLDGLAHLLVTGTCQDPSSGSIYVVARSNADPPIFYLRSYVNAAWSGWAKIPLDIKASQVVPAMYRGRVCLFWLQVKVNNEPSQSLPPAQASTTPANGGVDKYVALGVFFSTFRNGSWAPAQAAKGTLFDKVIFSSDMVFYAGAVGMTTQNSVAAYEALYSLKVQTSPPAGNYGENLFVDVFRLGDYTFGNESVTFFGITIEDLITVDFYPGQAVHLGRAVFDGRFNDLELNNAIPVDDDGSVVGLLAYAQASYGSDAQPLLPLTAPDPDLAGEPNLVPQSGALVTLPPDPTLGPTQTTQLTFTSVSALEQAVGPLLNAAPLPFRVVAPDSELTFDPTSYFFFEDNRRCYYVESQRTYWTGSWWSPTPPSYPNDVPFQMRYYFHRFYHPFTGLFWNQLGAGGFPLLYDRNLQLNPDQIDPSGSDVFSFQAGYSPVIPPVWWDHDDVTGADREYLDFGYSASYSVYNWELFFHIPLYIADLLSQNLQFEDAQTWYRYIFNPTLQGTDPVPQRFWVPKPFSTLTASAILAERINNLLVAVNNGDPSAIAEITSWRNDPFNPFLLADQRPVAYMKRTVMSYLDNLIAWGDNLFATDSREALSEATLLYVIASEILGPAPAAVTPPERADESYDQLEPKLDAFANAMVDIENVIGGSGGGSGGSSGNLPAAQTFYFKIPPNATLLGYWTTVADRLYKLRHCQNLQGQALTLALFDAPIDPGLLVAAQAAGVDLDSVLSGLAVALPNYRFTSLYPVALDFVNAVRAYGALLLSALTNSDADQLAVLTTTNQLELLQAADQIFDLQVQQAQSAIDSLNQALALAQQKFTFNTTQDFVNPFEVIDASINSALIINYGIVALAEWFGSVAALVPQFSFGAAGFGGSPTALAALGGKDYHASATAGANAGKALAAGLDKAAMLAAKFGTYERRQDAWNEAASEARFTIAQTNAQIAGASLALQIAVANQAKNQTQEAEVQSQLDFLTGKFTNQDLYDWMVGQLSATYFQSYQLAYRLCLQVQACYQFELGLPASSFIGFGYWDSLHKGLLSGESLNHDLRRMESSYLDQNRRRFEISRFISLGLLNPAALQQLLVSGACDFDLPETLFDGDYPGHYNRHLLRASVTVVYPNPGKFDNIKATLTLTANKVRTSTDVGGGYAEAPVGADPRFTYAYAAVPQKIVMGNAQDDAGLFIQTISSNLSDQRYLPFENAGAISSWHFEMLQASNEVDLTTVGDVVLHLYYTAVDGGDALKAAAEANDVANAPTSGTKAFSALNDFAAPAPSVANPYPLTPWQAFFAPPTGSDETLTLGVSPGKFPPWTRGKTISVTSLTVLVLAWNPGDFVLEPQAPLPSADLPMTPVAGVTEPNVCAATVTLPPNTPLGTWSFKIRQQAAADFKSLSKQAVGDVILLVNYEAN
jgi:hypothetical protein